MAIKKVVKKSLNKQVQENINAVITNRKKRTETAIKSGTPNDQANKHNIPTGVNNPRTVGMSVGMTKNMDNYESLRLDIWVTDEVQEGETLEEASQRLGEFLREQMDYELGEILS